MLNFDVSPYLEIEGVRVAQDKLYFALLVAGINDLDAYWMVEHLKKPNISRDRFPRDEDSLYRVSVDKNFPGISSLPDGTQVYIIRARDEYLEAIAAQTNSSLIYRYASIEITSSSFDILLPFIDFFWYALSDWFRFLPSNRVRFANDLITSSKHSPLKLEDRDLGLTVLCYFQPGSLVDPYSGNFINPYSYCVNGHTIIGVFDKQYQRYEAIVEKPQLVFWYELPQEKIGDIYRPCFFLGERSDMLRNRIEDITFFFEHF